MMKGKIITYTCNYVCMCVYICGIVLLCISSKMTYTHQQLNSLFYRF